MLEFVLAGAKCSEIAVGSLVVRRTQEGHLDRVSSVCLAKHGDGRCVRNTPKSRDAARQDAMHEILTRMRESDH
jgi:hypothetical protein